MRGYPLLKCMVLVELGQSILNNKTYLNSLNILTPRNHSVQIYHIHLNWLFCFVQRLGFRCKKGRIQILFSFIINPIRVWIPLRKCCAPWSMGPIITRMSCAPKIVDKSILCTTKLVTIPKYILHLLVQSESWFSCNVTFNSKFMSLLHYCATFEQKKRKVGEKEGWKKKDHGTFISLFGSW